MEPTGQPVKVDLKAGFGCNNDCIHCVAAGKRSAGDLGYAAIARELAAYSARYGRFDLVLTGGEFTIRPDGPRILDLVDRLKGRGSVRLCVLQTNARALSRPALARRYASTVDHFLVALHGHEPGLHDGITGSRGSFRETTGAVRRLLQAGARVRSQTVLSRRNFRFLPSILGFVMEELGLAGGNVAFPHPCGNAHSKEVVPTYGEISGSLNAAIRRLALAKGPIELYLEMIPLCVLDEEARSFVVPAPAEPPVVGTDASLKSGRDVSYERALQREYWKPPSCGGCVHDRRCLGTWRVYGEFYGGDGLRPVREPGGPARRSGRQARHGGGGMAPGCCAMPWYVLRLGGRREQLRAAMNSPKIQPSKIPVANSSPRARA